MLDGAQGDRPSRCVREGARNRDKIADRVSFSTSCPVANFHQPQSYRFRLIGEIWLGVVEAASDDPRIERDHRGGAKHNYVFHSFGWLICCGELLNDAGFAKGTRAVGDVTPKIAARCNCALHRLIERALQPRET